ncbi:tRNA (guanosine(46)-N7)-methyltransferase TrmB, partial [Francisella tularensis subsp. holarctica]|nr:tRNA (guanosine(46)-N7)-methyltransferase TrmB [Francisella tularensis subsp. holarctica]
MRQIKRNVQRSRRVTKKQQQALDNYAAKNLIEYAKYRKLDITEIFANTKDVVLEIGFCMGGSLGE